jgi:hypothetical protein
MVATAGEAIKDVDVDGVDVNVKRQHAWTVGRHGEHKERAALRFAFGQITHPFLKAISAAKVQSQMSRRQPLRTLQTRGEQVIEFCPT